MSCGNICTESYSNHLPYPKLHSHQERSLVHFQTNTITTTTPKKKKKGKGKTKTRFVLAVYVFSTHSSNYENECFFSLYPCEEPRQEAFCKKAIVKYGQKGANIPRNYIIKCRKVKAPLNRNQMFSTEQDIN